MLHLAFYNYVQTASWKRGNCIISSFLLVSQTRTLFRSSIPHTPKYHGYLSMKQYMLSPWCHILMFMSIKNDLWTSIHGMLFLSNHAYLLHGWGIYIKNVYKEYFPCTFKKILSSARLNVYFTIGNEINICIGL